MRYILVVHVISRKALQKFAQKNPQCKSALDSWYRIIKKTDYDSFSELRKTFKSADKVGKFTVFNIGGNKARLITAIHYNARRIYIRHVITHVEYNKGNWKE